MNEPKAQASNCRAQINSLLKKINQSSQQIIAKRSLVKGTIYDSKRKCGHKQCKCATGGQLHSTPVLSFSHQGKAQSVGLSKYAPHEREKITQKVNDYREFRQCRAKIVQYFAETIEQLNLLEESLLVTVTSARKISKERKNNDNSEK